MNSFGRIFKVSIFGESHGECVGITIDGCPAGLSLSPEDLAPDLERRKGGKHKGTTPRKEEDFPIFKSGVFNGKTTGFPITILFENKNIRSEEYTKQRSIPRPGHADWVAHQKFGGFEDYRGGGHFSARLTAGIVAAGAIAKKLMNYVTSPQTPLQRRGAYDHSNTAGNEEVLNKAEWVLEEIKKNLFVESDSPSPLEREPEGEVLKPALTIQAKVIEIGGDKDLEKGLQKAIDAKDSVGGIIECRVNGLPAGLGEPWFDSVESVLAHLVFAIPAVRGVEFGTGFAAAKMFGSEHNDSIMEMSGQTKTNHAGGIVGGITNGNELVFRLAIKPTSSTPKEQESLNWDTEQVEKFSIKGRHDLCVALRAPVIVEAVTALVLCDFMMLEQKIPRIIL
ncbi:MAG TPA: chorismate synthase [Chitinophagaceae bacterium]|nr:chorismate synthase [Chitinophagaceae bacterium]